MTGPSIDQHTLTSKFDTHVLSRTAVFVFDTSRGETAWSFPKSRFEPRFETTVGCSLST